MKREVMEGWVKALRSGKYKQGKQRLKNSLGEYCCLGVLCDISNLSEWCGENYFYSNIVLSSPVMKWAHLKSSGNFDLSEIAQLSNMNDNGKTFEEIANYIEKNYKNI